MSQTRDELEAQFIAEYRADLEKINYQDMEDRIRSNYEVDKINELSKGCKRFLNSKIGRFIQNEAATQSEAAKDELAAIVMEKFPSREHFLYKIKELQTEAHIPALVITWLHRAIQKAEEEAGLLYEE